MTTTKIKVSEFKKIMSKMSMGVEKSSINPDAGYVAIETDGDATVKTTVSNKDYFLESSLNAECGDDIRVTINADTFIGIISKLDSDTIELHVENNALVITTSASEYTFPIVTVEGQTKELHRIEFDEDNAIHATMTGKDIISVADSNLQGLVNAEFKREISQFIYVDNKGALTATNYIYLNEFDNPSNTEFKFLVNGAQADLLKVFGQSEKVNVCVSNAVGNEKIYVKLSSDTPSISLTCITQTPEMVAKFPAQKIRELAFAISDVHVVISKSKLEKALGRLQVFDKKGNTIAIRDKSQFVFGNDSVKLVSPKYHSFEIVKYEKSTNANEYSAMLRFDEVVNQLKATQSQFVDISYGNGKTVIFNSDIKQIIPEQKRVEVNG